MKFKVFGINDTDTGPIQIDTIDVTDEEADSIPHDRGRKKTKHAVAAFNKALKMGYEVCFVEKVRL